MAGLSGLGYNQQSQTWWVVFTKTSEGTPWVIAFFASYAEGDGLDGFTSNSASTPATVQYPLQNAPQDYADYFQNLDATGNPGSGAPTDFSQDNILNSEVTNTTQLDNRYTAEGLHQAFSHTVDQVSPIFAQVVNGSVVGAMECFSVTVTNNVTSAKGSPIVQPANQQTWGYQIPPGSYSSLNFPKDYGACARKVDEWHYAHLGLRGHLRHRNDTERLTVSRSGNVAQVIQQVEPLWPHSRRIRRWQGQAVGSRRL